LNENRELGWNIPFARPIALFFSMGGKKQAGNRQGTASKGIQPGSSAIDDWFELSGAGM